MFNQKIKKHKPKQNIYSACRKSITINNEEDVDTYFQCFKIPNIIKLLCINWIKNGHGCHLDCECFYSGTLYLTLTRKASFYNHIHLFPSNKNSFTWHDKISQKNGKCTNVKNINKYVILFENMLKINNQ